MEKILSIIVPVYNVEKYVERCLTSLVVNNLTYEVIIINDGSTDNSDKICTDFCKRHEQFHYFQKDNGGLSDARNFGIKKSIGKYILFVDSDDYVDTREFEKVFKYLNNGNEIICYDHKEVDEKGTFITYGYNYDDYSICPISGIEFYYNRIMKKSFPAAACFNIYSSSLIKQNNIFFKKGIYHEDEEWTPRVFIKSKSVIHINSILYFYVRRDGTITTSTKTAKKVVDLVNTYKELEIFFSKNLDYEQIGTKHILDYLARQYMNAFSGDMDKNTYNEIKKMIDYNFIKRNIKYTKTRIKYFIFRTSLKLYNFLKKV